MAHWNRSATCRAWGTAPGHRAAQGRGDPVDLLRRDQHVDSREHRHGQPRGDTHGGPAQPMRRRGGGGVVIGATPFSGAAASTRAPLGPPRTEGAPDPHHHLAPPLDASGPAPIFTSPDNGRRSLRQPRCERPHRSGSGSAAWPVRAATAHMSGPVPGTRIARGLPPGYSVSRPGRSCRAPTVGPRSTRRSRSAPSPPAHDRPRSRTPGG